MKQDNSLYFWRYLLAYMLLFACEQILWKQDLERVSKRNVCIIFCLSYISFIQSHVVLATSLDLSTQYAIYCMGYKVCDSRSLINCSPLQKREKRKKHERLKRLKNKESLFLFGLIREYLAFFDMFSLTFYSLFMIYWAT